MNIKAIQAETERHTNVMNELISQLKNHILDLPDNPRIKRLGDKPNCFTISLKDLGDNWSVEHHDFKEQYNLIISELERGEKDNALNKLQKIVEEGKLIISSGGSKHTLTLHLDVVSHLGKLIDVH